MEYVLQAANSRTSLSFPHASSGNPGGIRTGPPIKTFGGDDPGESHLFISAAIFEGVTRFKSSNIRTLCGLRGERLFYLNRLCARRSLRRYSDQ